MLTAAEQKDIQAIGIRLYNLRKDLGLSRERLAEICDIAVNTIASIETGGKDVKATTLMKIASGLGCSTDYLLYGTEHGGDMVSTSRLRLLTEKAIQELDGRKLAAYTEQMESLLKTLSSL